MRTLFALGAVVLAGCGAATAGPGPAPSAEMSVASKPSTDARARNEPAATRADRPERSRRSNGTRIKEVDSQFGRILADGRGQALYYFDKERTRSSECYGACARAWPPVLAKGRPVAGAGARRALIGTTRRRNGRRQLTYDGRPLYYYVADAPGRVLCHNVFEFGGLWLVIRPDGAPVA